MHAQLPFKSTTHQLVEHATLNTRRNCNPAVRDLGRPHKRVPAESSSSYVPRRPAFPPIYPSIALVLSRGICHQTIDSFCVSASHRLSHYCGAAGSTMTCPGRATANMDRKTVPRFDLGIYYTRPGASSLPKWGGVDNKIKWGWSSIPVSPRRDDDAAHD